MVDSASDDRLETRLVHAGEPTPRADGAVAMPVFQSSTFTIDRARGEAGYHDLRYIRLNNTPNQLALAAKLAAIEGGEAALVTGSGMAAISTTLLSLLGAGDHLLAQRELYGGTHALLTDNLPRLGIGATFIDAGAPASWKAALRPTTRVLYVEAISNPLLRIGDLAAAASFARAHGLVSIIDATFATPVNLRPIDLGFDLVLHSATKYLNGHSDIVAGALIGRAVLVEKTKHLLDHLGGSLDPHACFLLQRGLKTLSLRVRHQSASALTLARFLEAHPAVAAVHYPGLESHPDHARARPWFSGFGGVLSFELRGGVEAADRLIARARLPLHAPSLGGPETLLTRPATASHAGLTPEDRARAGLPDALLRLCVGLEAPEDLLADLDQALR
ncbi:trans-sulfuration enzyme family protein [Chondromyces apiculatus]|uniref:O-acetylhomoserine sulfhydrylase n=1 Tax=Chondromyces apiculatus DSM 436 TaxID=1192034 RepID=A0A017TH97_9BACT|nr:aminotransferase class I/II-fold pyridoxal phosphate-dependent enzyme [Chondromyces apiculatus]EYF07981.1 O-acetylhomoserine sulfhydrylase [Chondromyces apiculatus DSM 436]